MDIMVSFEERKEQAESYGIKVNFVKKPYIVLPGDCKVVGYFCTETKQIRLAIEADDWIPTGIHEFCHFDQWLCGSKWSKAFDSCKHVMRFDRFIGGDDYLNIEQSKKAMRTIRALELDCEKRTVKQILKYGLPIDIEEYTQRANAYMYYHSIMIMFRQFHRKSSPYRTKEVWKTMPTHFLKAIDYDNPPSDYILLCREHCY